MQSKTYQTSRNLRNPASKYGYSSPDNKPVNNGVAIFNLSGKIRSVNEQFGKLFGYSKEDLQNRNVKDIIPNIRPDLIRFLNKNYVDDKLQYRSEYQGIHRKGNSLDLSINFYPMTINAEKLYMAEVKHIHFNHINLQSDQGKKTIDIHKDLNENLPVSIYKYDQKSKRFSYLSNGIKGITGYSPEELKRNDICWEDIIYTDDKKQVKKKRKEALYCKQHYRLTYRVQTKKGDLRWIFEHGYGIYDDLNQIIRTEGFIYDQTEKKQEEDLMYKRLAIYRLMSENSSDLAFLLYPDLRVRFASESVKEILGYTTDEILENPLSTVIIKEDRHKLSDKMLKEVLDGKEFKKILFRAERKDSRKVWLEAIVKPFKNRENEIRGIHVVSRDVTQSINRQKEQKRLSNELREKTLVLESIFDTMAEGVVVIDKEGNYRGMNKAARKIYDVGSVEDISETDVHPPVFYSLKSKRELDPEEMPMKLALKGEKVDDFEVYVKGLFDEYGYYASMNARPLKDANQNIVGCITVLRDVDNSKKLQFALEKEKDKAEKAAQIKSQFLSNMSHEIRTPLNGIVALINFLTEKDPRKDQLEHLKLLKFSSDHLMALINNILDLNKIDEGKLELEYREWDLRKHLENILQMYEMNASDKGIDLLLKFDEKIKYKYCYDKVRVTQVVSNLINNAIKFTDKGKVELKVKCFEYDDEQCRIRFEIIDTGIGIEAEKIKNIFEQFSQADKSIAARYGGSGLGLAISKKLLELMDSDLELESEPGKGTNFFFTLTLKRGKEMETMTREKKKKDIKIENGGFNILVVDDNHVNLLVAERYLKGWGGQVTKVGGGKEALKLLKSNSFDILLLDIQMPDVDGIEVTRRIRNAKNTDYKDIPIIAISAAVMKQDKQKAFDAGVNEYVTKPFDPEDLRVAMSKYLKKAGSVEKSGENNNNKKSEGEYEEDKVAAKKKSMLNNFLEAIDFYSEGDEEFRKEFISTLVKGFNEFKESGVRNIEEGDLEEFRKVHHKIKSNIKILKLEELNTWSDKVKSMMRDGNEGILEEITEKIKDQVNEVIDLLHEIENKWNKNLKISA